MNFSRITVDPLQMAGEPCIRGYRMPVATVVRMVADGWSFDEILKEWPELEKEDIVQALRFASEASKTRQFTVPEA
jgi:uncharacterized protein (DUF433 family)